MLFYEPHVGELIKACLKHAKALDEIMRYRELEPTFELNFLRNLHYLNTYGCEAGNTIDPKLSTVVMMRDGPLDFALSFHIQNAERPDMVGGLNFHGPRDVNAAMAPDFKFEPHMGWSVNT